MDSEANLDPFWSTFGDHSGIKIGQQINRISGRFWEAFRHHFCEDCSCMFGSFSSEFVHFRAKATTCEFTAPADEINGPNGGKRH